MYKVLDTNILLLDANNLVNLGADGSIIVLPETTIDELDSKKSGTSEIAFQARQVGRLLTGATKGETRLINDLTLTERVVEGTKIWIASSSQYPDYSDVELNILNDRKIIEIAYQLHHSNTGDVTFVSNDVMCLLRAEAVGLTSIDLKEVETLEFSFTKELEVSEEVFKELRTHDILSIDPDYTAEYYNYKFTCSSTAQVKIGTVTNDILSIITKDKEKEYRRQDITPIGMAQLFLADAIQNPITDIVVCEALAGAGKTLTSLSNAIRLVKQKRYTSILYIRASVDDVPKEEEVGFLSGNDSKMEVYLHPLEDSLDFIVRNKYKGSKVKGIEFEEKVALGVVELKQSCNIQGMTGLGLRGRTFHDAIILIDEVQNMSKASLQKVMTRVGKGSKVILLGSNRQIDNPYLTKYTNGLSSILDACTRKYDTVNLHAVTLTKVIRGNIAEFVEHLFDKGA